MSQGLTPVGKFSSQSHYSHSRSYSQLMDMENVPPEKLVKQINELKLQVRILKLENEIIERTITRTDPSLMQGIQQAFDYAVKIHSSSTSLHSQVPSKSQSKFLLDSSRTHSLHSQSRSRVLTSPSSVSTARRGVSSAKISATVIFGTGPKVNILERVEIVNNEMEFMADTLDRARKKAAKQHALLKAQLEECAIRVEDIEKANEDFNQEVIVEGWDKIAQRIPAEVWIRYMIQWTRLIDKQIGKLRLRTSTLNSQFSRLKGQIKAKAELSESLRPVDFEKLKIENRQCQAEIDQKLQQLQELKKMTGDANLNLAVHKKAMMEQNKFLENVLKSIQQKHKLVKDLNREKDLIHAQADILANRLDEVKRCREDFEVPDIMEYVQVKSDLHDMTQIIKTLENRLHLKQICLGSLNREMRSMLLIPTEQSLV